MKEESIDSKKMSSTDTDMHYEMLADPSKLKMKDKVITIPNDISEESSLYSPVHSESSKSSKRSSRSSKKSPKISPKRSPSPPKIEIPPQPIPEPIQPPRVPSPIIQEPPPVYQPETKFPPTYMPSYNQSDDKTIRFRKMELLSKLYDIQKSGRQLTRIYNMQSEIEDMEMEIKYQIEIENKKSKVNICKSFLLNTISAIEFMNDRYDPFGLQLSGWSDQMKGNIDNYNDVFAELYEKYKSSGKKMEPELKFILMITGSAVSFHITKSMTKSAGLENIVKNSPDLLSKLQSSLSGAIEKNIGGTPQEKKDSTIHQTQQEMYKNMMEKKQETNKLSNIIKDVKMKVPIDVSKYDTSESSSRIKNINTVDTDTTTDIMDSIKKSRKKRTIKT